MLYPFMCNMFVLASSSTSHAPHCRFRLFLLFFGINLASINTPLTAREVSDDASYLFYYFQYSYTLKRLKRCLVKTLNSFQAVKRPYFSIFLSFCLFFLRQDIKNIFLKILLYTTIFNLIRSNKNKNQPCQSLLEDMLVV